MGYLFEYCDKYCRELYGVNIDKIKLLTAFMNSDFRREMEQGHPKFLSQSARDSLMQWISADYGNNLEEFETHIDQDEYRENQFYWVGWIYAYIHYRTRRSSRRIVSRLPIEQMLNNYYFGHEMSKETYFARIEDKVWPRNKKYKQKS